MKTLGPTWMVAMFVTAKSILRVHTLRSVMIHLITINLTTAFLNLQLKKYKIMLEIILTSALIKAFN